jgi:hypothetical protein
MIDDKDIGTLISAFLELRREHCKTLARVLALEAVILEDAPPADRAELHRRINEWQAQNHQRILEEFEKHSPHVAAILNDRRLEDIP